MQGPDKNMPYQTKLLRSFEKLLLWKGNIANVSGISQCFTLLSNLLENTCTIMYDAAFKLTK